MLRDLDFNYEKSVMANLTKFDVLICWVQMSTVDTTDDSVEYSCVVEICSTHKIKKRTPHLSQELFTEEKHTMYQLSWICVYLNYT